MYPLQPSSTQQRNLLKWLRSELGSKIGIQNIRPVTIRAFAPLKNDDSQIEFDLRDSKKVVAGAEILIPDNRVVYGNLWGFGVAIVPVVGRVNGVGGVEKPGNMTLTSYPHPALFSNADPDGAGAGIAELEALKMLWNGSMRMETETKTRFDKVACSDFKILDDQTDVPNLGIKHVDMQQAYAIYGDKSNLVQIKLAPGNYSNIAGNDSKAHYAVLEIKGFELLNAIKNEYVTRTLGE
jgi:hypothetical protein